MKMLQGKPPRGSSASDECWWEDMQRKRFKVRLVIKTEAAFTGLEILNLFTLTG